VPCDVLHRIGAERRIVAGGRVGCDVVLARLATGQSGVVGRAQLVSIGFSRREIELLVTARRLIRIHRGAYAVGHDALMDRGRVIAALLAIGDGAVGSHWTAAVLWRLLPSMPPFVDVTLTDRRPRQREGISIHHASDLETTRHQGLPVTTPRQTLSDLEGPDADHATSEALYLGLIDRGEAPQDEPTRSELERKLLPTLQTAGCRGRLSTTASAATRSTSSGRTRSSPWRPTDGPDTAIASRSSATARVTPTCRLRASRCSDSRGGR